MEKPLLIFLDVDGVMAPIQKVFHPPEDSYHKEAIREINRLCEKTGAEVVITSSRLRLQHPDMFVNGLKKAGFIGTFHSPPTLPRSPWNLFCRGHDIEQFMALHEPTRELNSILIIDNNSAGYSKEQIDQLVQTKSHKGFSERNCEEALKKLGLENRLDELSPVRPR